MIEGISIRDFRGIHTGRLDGFRRVNVLVGPNNSGKTAVLEALYLACTADRQANLTTDDTGPVTYDTVGVERRDLLGDSPIARVRGRHSMVETERLAEWSQGLLRVRVEDRQARLRGFQLTTEDGFQADDTERTALFSVAGRGPEVTRLKADLMEMSHDEPSEDMRTVYCWQRRLTYAYRGSAAWSVAGRPAAADRTLFFDPATILGHFRMDFVRRMLPAIPGWVEFTGASLRRVLAHSEPLGVQFLPADSDAACAQAWLTRGSLPALSVDSFGDGTRAAMKLLSPLLALAVDGEGTPGVVLWEEPEVFQNPRTLGSLLKEVLTVLREKPLQLFVSSHSLEVIAHLTMLAKEGIVEGDDVRVFRLDLREGELVSSWFDESNLLAWFESGLDPRVWGDFQMPIECRWKLDT